MTPRCSTPGGPFAGSRMTRPTRRPDRRALWNWSAAIACRDESSAIAMAAPGADRVAPHVLVAPSVPIDFPSQRGLDAVRARVQDLRRVVWRRRGTEGYFPGTIFYVDGREARFRSLRWSDDGVIVLLADGPRRAPFNDIAELHLPRADNWHTYYTALAIKNPACDARLFQAETADHLIVTTSLERFQARSLGGDQRQWYHMFQPSWSLDPLWVRHATIEWRRFWDPHEVPLSILAA